MPKQRIKANLCFFHLQTVPRVTTPRKKKRLIFLFKNVVCCSAVSDAHIVTIISFFYHFSFHFCVSSADIFGFRDHRKIQLKCLNLRILFSHHPIHTLSLLNVCKPTLDFISFVHRVSKRLNKQTKIREAKKQCLNHERYRNAPSRREWNLEKCV
jgi:hypothetical protein